MASSVARMPSDAWRLHLRARSPLPNALIGISASINPSSPTNESLSPETMAKRRQSQTLDRKAARQMITTAERQAHEEELSALSTIAVAAIGDVQPSLRASSLIQMWREMEAEAGLCVPLRVGLLSQKVSSFLASFGDESELSAAKEIAGDAAMPRIGGKALRVRGRWEMKDFILKLEGERRREVADIGERPSVSRFPFRGRIQSLIRLRSLRQEVATIRHQQRTQKIEEQRSNNVFMRKPVSTSLTSKFSAKMNQLIASFLHKQGQQYADVNDKEECEEEGTWRQHYESSSDQKATATSLAQSSPSSKNSSPSVQEGEDMHDLKNSVAHIHHEIFELRKLVESCLDWQKKLGHSVKQELFGAVNQIAGRGSLVHNSKCMEGRKYTCCICCEAHIIQVWPHVCLLQVCSRVTTEQW